MISQIKSRKAFPFNTLCRSNAYVQLVRCEAAALTSEGAPPYGFYLYLSVLKVANEGSAVRPSHDPKKNYISVLASGFRFIFYLHSFAWVLYSWTPIVNNTGVWVNFYLNPMVCQR